MTAIIDPSYRYLVQPYPCCDLQNLGALCAQKNRKTMM